jgi:metal-responsive CopG/Arc/MetJ family transcriptional regulator
MFDPTNHATIGRMSRVKVSVTLDPDLLEAVDGFVQDHPGQDRSKVIDQALQHWYTRQQELAMVAQYEQSNDAMESEQTSWRGIRRASATRRLSRT